MDGIGENGANTVILEIVERNLPDLQKYAPLMSAPVTENLSFKTLEVCDDLTVKSEKTFSQATIRKFLLLQTALLTGLSMPLKTNCLNVREKQVTTVFPFTFPKTQA